MDESARFSSSSQPDGRGPKTVLRPDPAGDSNPEIFIDAMMEAPSERVT